MIRPDVTKWNQKLSDLRRLSVEAEQPRTRERFLALYMIATKQTNATKWAAEIGRSDESVLSWVRAYNKKGPEALTYRRTGGRPPLFRPSKSRKSSTP
jgi:transposase